MQKLSSYARMATARDKIAPSLTTLSKRSVFWSSGLLDDHNGVALTNVNFKNLSEQFGFRGRQDHNDEYVEDFEVVWIHTEGGEMAKCLRLSENPTTYTGGLTAKHRKTLQEMRATDGGSRDTVKLLEEFLRRRLLEMRTSGPLCLIKIQRPKTVQVQDGRTKPRQDYENPTLNVDEREFQSLHQKVCIRKTAESRTAKAQDHSDHRSCQRMLA